MPKPMSIREAVAWIADNDEPGNPEAFNAWAVSSLVTVNLIAELSGNEPFDIARRVIKVREDTEIRHVIPFHGSGDD